MKHLLYIRRSPLGNVWRYCRQVLVACWCVLALVACAKAPQPDTHKSDTHAGSPTTPLETSAEGASSAEPVPIAPVPGSAQSRPLKGKELGREFVHVALRQFRFNTNDVVTSLVQRVGRDMVLGAGDDPGRYHFFVVENPQANAFAIPGGYIFIFDGLLERLNSEEELAGVMAHEVGHVRLAHFFKDQKKVALADLAVLAAILLGQAHEAVTAFSLAGSASLQLAFSREHEREADTAALTYLAAAQYDQAGLVGFFETLSRQQRLLLPKGQYRYLSTHPGLDERLLRVERAIRRSGGPSVPRHDPLPWVEMSGVLAADTLIRRPARGGDFPQGVALLTASRFGAALPYLERAAAAAPQSARVQVALATSLLRLGRVVPALTVASKAVDLDPNYAPAHFLLGEVARQAGGKVDAEISYRRALAADPNHSMSHFRLSELLLAAGEEGWGNEHLARYLRLTLKPGQAMALLRGIDTLSDPKLAADVARQMADLQADGV